MNAVRNTLLTDIKSYEQQLTAMEQNSARHKNIQSVIETLKMALVNIDNYAETNKTPSDPQQEKIFKTKSTRNDDAVRNGQVKSIRELVDHVKQAETRFQILHRRVRESGGGTGIAELAMREEHEGCVEECLLACGVLEERCMRA